MAETLARDLPYTEKGVFIVVSVLGFLSILDTTYLFLRERRKLYSHTRKCLTGLPCWVMVGVMLVTSLNYMALSLNSGRAI